MEKRYLGNSGLEVSVLGFGAMTFGEGVAANTVTGHMATADAARLFDICVDAGVTLFDTADVYAAGSSEEILGQVARAKRHRVLIATKAFGRMGRGDHDMGLSRRHLIDACDASLRRLGTDWIDLYQVHNFDSRAPVEETLRTLDDLVRSGKVRYIGCSNFAAWQLMKALGASDRQRLERYVGQQIQYSLMVRDAELEMLPAGVDQGVGALIWSPLAQGFLSGKFRRDHVQGDTRLGSGGGLKSWNNERGHAIVDTLFDIAGEIGNTTPSQIALAWVKARPGVSSVLVGARTEAQLLDNLAAAELVLSDDQMQRLDTVSQPASSYPNSHQRFFSETRNPQLFPRYRK